MKPRINVFVKGDSDGVEIHGVNLPLELYMEEEGGGEGEAYFKVHTHMVGDMRVSFYTPLPTEFQLTRKMAEDIDAVWKEVERWIAQYN